MFSLFPLSLSYINAEDRKSILPLSQQWELSTKLVLNAVSTGAHVLKGKIYQNHMIDVQVTNSKLYRRATRLLQVDKITLLMKHKHDFSHRSPICMCLKYMNIFIH